MRSLSSLGTTRLTQSTGGLRLNESVARYCPGFFAGNSFGTFGQMKVNLEGSIAPRAGTVGLAYAGNGTTNCAVVPWSGINLNTQPEMTWVLLYKKNAKGTQQTYIAGFGSTSGSTGNTLFRFVGGVNSANAVRIQAQDSYGSVFFNIDSSDFGADDLRYHCVVVSGKVSTSANGGGLQYYADGRKLNFAPSENDYNIPTPTLFNIVTLLGARRGGVLTGADGNYDVALFVPLFGVRQSDAWCQSISQNPWQLFAPIQQPIFVPYVEIVAPGYRPTSDILTTGWTAIPGPTFAASVDELSPDNADFITSSSTGLDPIIMGLNQNLPVGTWEVKINASYTNGARQIRAVLLDGVNAVTGTSSWVPVPSTSYNQLTLPVTTTALSSRIRIEVQ